MERCIERHALRMCASALFAQTCLKRAGSFRGPMNDKSTICLDTPVSSALPRIGRQLPSQVPFLEELAVIFCYRHDLLNNIYDFVIG